MRLIDRFRRFLVARSHLRVIKRDLKKFGVAVRSIPSSEHYVLEFLLDFLLKDGKYRVLSQEADDPAIAYVVCASTIRRK